MRGQTLLSLELFRGLQIDDLTVAKAPVVDLDPLKGVRLRTLAIAGTSVLDLSPLKGLPLEELGLNSTGVSDLTPLQGALLKYLNPRYCKKLTDYTPVLTLPRRRRPRRAYDARHAAGKK